MTEGILYLFAAVVIFAVLRSVIGVVLKGIADFFGGSPSQPNPAGPGPGPRGSSLPVPEALKKDPVCGTFLPPSSALRKTIGGETYYFCSAECRDKFKG